MKKPYIMFLVAILGTGLKNYVCIQKNLLRSLLVLLNKKEAPPCDLVGLQGVLFFVSSQF